MDERQDNRNTWRIDPDGGPADSVATSRPLQPARPARAGEIPVIDLAPLTDGRAGLDPVAQAVGEACERIGFFYVVNHGVPATLVEETFEQTRRFALKHADKPWSLTDCHSFLVMRERNISQALTKDRHFRQAGFAPLLID